MITLASVPLRAEDTVEHALLHAVLCLDTEQVLHPRAADTEQEIEQDKDTHHSNCPIEVPF